jgi:hypothetical protein
MATTDGLNVINIDTVQLKVRITLVASGRYQEDPYLKAFDRSQNKLVWQLKKNCI